MPENFDAQFCSDLGLWSSSKSLCSRYARNITDFRNAFVNLEKENGHLLEDRQGSK